MKITESTHFWAFKHKPGKDASEEISLEFVLNAIRSNFASMQYEYDAQSPNTVSQNWNQILKIREGDILFLRGNEKVYAVGQVIKPRLKSTVVLNAEKIIKDNSHGKYSSRQYNGVILFEDSPVFYENLEGEEQWGQRIDVDSWHYFCPNGINVKADEWYVQGANNYGVLKELPREKGEKLIKLLRDDIGTIADISNILMFNHNLILTGAPGTGKTYMAKQLARFIMFGKKDPSELSKQEEEVFNEQCGFVQFHPSYDYTDFVEGLRPTSTQNGNNQIDNESVGFERIDGVFKSFCKQALKIANGIPQFINFDDIYNDFIDYIIGNGPIQLETPYYHKKFKVDVNSKNYLVAIPQTEIASNCIIKKEVLRDYLETGNISDWKPYLPPIGEYVKKKYKFSSKTADKKAKFIFIIDEINRGEISKIFGELFFSIDPGYRGKDGKVRTQYANMQTTPNKFDKSLGITDSNNCGHFFVPENVYIIGTMNDIDRSVESMDFAFRRRFAFKEIKASETQNMLDNEKSWKDKNGNIVRPDQDTISKIKNRMDNLNNVIWNKKTKSGIEGLSSAYHIGASYFLKLANYRNNGTYDNSSFKNLWDYHLEGLLREYLRGMQDVDTLIENLSKAYNNESAPNNG